MYPVEVKRRNTIGVEVIEQMKEKVARLPNPDAVSIRPVLVYDGSLSPAIIENAYFADVVSAADLLLR